MKRFVGMACALAFVSWGAGEAFAQGCPNPQTGPLIGTTGEYCFSSAEQNNIDFNLPVAMSTNVGPQQQILNINGMRQICKIWWVNPTCWFWIPPPGFCCGSVGRFTGCGPVFLAEYCLSLTPQGQALMGQAAAACPQPTPPPAIACGATRVICVSCPGPGFLFPCEYVKVPVKVPVKSNITFIDCQDFANYTDTSGVPQSKMCFHVRQKCVDECVSGTPVCTYSDAESGQILGCIYDVPYWDWSNEPDIPADGSVDPDADEIDPLPGEEENDEHNPVNPSEDGGFLGPDPR